MNNPTTNQLSKHVFLETKPKEEVTKEKEEYRQYLEKHNFTEMNFPFTSFLRKNEPNVGFEGGAI